MGNSMNETPKRHILGRKHVYVCRQNQSTDAESARAEELSKKVYLRNHNTCSPRPPTLSQRHMDLHVWAYPRRPNRVQNFYTIMHNIFHQLSLSYLKDLVTFYAVNYARHPPDLTLSVGQQRISAHAISRSAGAGRMFGTVSIRHIDDHATFRRALNTCSIFVALVLVLNFSLIFCNAQSICFYV